MGVWCAPSALAAGGGALDRSFGGDGRIALPGAGSFVPRSVAVDRADRIVVGGYTCDSSSGSTDATCLGSGDSNFRIARLTRDGGLDPEFGYNGFVQTKIGEGRSQALDVILMPGGDIVAGGVAVLGGRDVFALARYTPSGALDPAFGAGGVVLAPIGSSYSSIHDIEPSLNGSILAAGQAVDGAGIPRAAVAHFLSDGSLDPGFGAGGSTLGGASNFDYALGMTVSPNGSITTAGIAGSTSSQTTYAFGELRLNPSGTVTTAFGPDGNGTAKHRLGTSTSFANAIVGAGHNGYVAAGAALVSDGRQAMAFMRATSAGAPDPGFGSDGYVLIPQLDGASVNDLIDYPGGRVLAIGQAAHNGLWSFAQAKLLPDGRLDPTWGRGGVLRVHFSDFPSARATAGALSAGGKVVTVGIGCDGGDNSTTCEGGRSVLLVTRQLGHAPATRDTTSPHMAVRGLPRTISSAALRRQGIPLRLALSEPARVEIVASRASGRVARVARKQLARKVTARLRLRTGAGRVRIVIRAVDGAGNATTRPFTLRVT